jgi:hypothetical protein
MTISEKLEDVRFKYVYVKAFKWGDPLGNERFGGHPKAGGVYRTIYNINSKSYKLLLNNTMDFLLLTALTTTDDLGSSEIEALTPHNIVGFDLTEEQLDKLVTWITTDNADIRERYTKSTPNFSEVFSTALVKQVSTENTAMTRVVHTCLPLHQINPQMLDLVMELIQHLIDDEYSKAEDTLNIALTTEGKGLNIHHAVHHLQDYMRPVKLGGDERVSLINSILNILTELERRSINELD